MANTNISGFEKTLHPVLVESEATKEKSIFDQEELAEEKAVEEKVVSEEDSAKAQFFNDLTAHLKKLTKNLEESQSREDVSEDLSISRQLTLNSVTNMLSSIDNLELTGEELSLLEQTAQEMEKVLQQATQPKKGDVLRETQLQETVEQMSEADSQKMAGVRVDPVAMSLPWEAQDVPTMQVASTPTTATTAKSDKDIASKLSEIMTKADKEYLQVYEYASKVRAEFQEKIAEVQQVIPNHISTETNDDNDHKGDIRVNARDIHNKITEIIDVSEFSSDLSGYMKYTEAMRKIALYPPNYNQSGTKPLPATPEGKAEAEYWANEFPGSRVEELRTTVISTGEVKVTGYIVVIDLEPVEKILDSLFLPTSFWGAGVVCLNGSYLSPTAFQTWQTGLNSQIETIKTSTQELSQGYNNANSIATTLNKLLTASIQTLFDSLAQYLRF